MSREGDRSTFYTYELPKHAVVANDSQKNNATALMESLRLKKENDDLWLCLKLMRDNSELQCANLISAVIAWSDDKFKRRFLELDSALTRHHLESKSPFRPITPPLHTPALSVSPHDVIGTSPHLSNVGRPRSRSPSPVYRRNTTARSRSPSPVYHRNTTAPSPTQGSVYDDGGQRSSVQVYSKRTSIVQVGSRKTSKSSPSPIASSPFRPLSATQGSVYEGFIYSPSPINSTRNVSPLKDSQSQTFSPVLDSQTEISTVTNIVQDGVPKVIEHQMTNPVNNTYRNSQTYPPQEVVVTSSPIYDMNAQLTGYYVNERRVSPTAPYSRSPRSFDEGSNGRLSSRRLSPDPPASPQPKGPLINQRTIHHSPEQINSPFYRPISPSQMNQNEQRYSNVQSHSTVMKNKSMSPTGRLSPVIKEISNSIDHTEYSSGFFQDSASYSRYPSTLDSGALISPGNSSARSAPKYEQRNTGSTSPRFGQSSNHSPFQQPVPQKPLSMRELQFGPSRKSPVPEHISRNNEGRIPTPFPGDFVVTDYDTSVQSESGASSVGQPLAFSTPLKGQGHRISPIQEMFEEEIQMKRASQAHYTRSRSGSSISSVVKQTTFKPTHRLLGEIAFQLERRILDFIFATRKKGQKERLHRRFYGYTVSNIPVMITRESTNKDGTLDHVKRVMYQKRYDQIIISLSAFGYTLQNYSYYCLKMINKYGLLSQPPDRQTMEICGLQNPVTLRLYINDLAQNDKERSHMLVILECLLLLAHDDGQSVFLW